MLFIFFPILLLFSSSTCFSQQKFTTTIILPPGIDFSAIHITYDNGKTSVPVCNEQIQEGKIIINGIFFSRYATLQISYPKTANSFYAYNYFIKEGVSSITYSYAQTDSSMQQLFDSVKLHNAIAIDRIPALKILDKLVQSETAGLDTLWKKYEASSMTDDSLLTLFNKKLHDIALKKLHYIQTQPYNYYYLWVFKTELLPELAAKQALLLQEVFYSYFPEKYQNSFEGKEIRKTLNGFIRIHDGAAAPLLIAKDVNGHLIRSTDFKGKFFLLQFWATWCVPCMSEMQGIKKIRTQYDESRLVIVGVSLDTDYGVFLKEIKKDNLNWIHIFNTKEVIKNYGITGIPQVFLIDPSGKIIFSSKDNTVEKLYVFIEKMIKK